MVIAAGCDEAGRGCLAGPVFAAAVILDPAAPLNGLNDSKLLTAGQREDLRSAIEEKALAWSVARVDPPQIDRENILWASVSAMHIAISQLDITPTLLLIDGNRFKLYPGIPHRCIVGGDGLIRSIAAASILAKTYRDAFMEDLHNDFPVYAWRSNKGYATAAHREAILNHGITPHHRRSFRLWPEPELF